jgi:hypothetical protein
LNFLLSGFSSKTRNPAASENTFNTKFALSLSKGVFSTLVKNTETMKIISICLLNVDRRRAEEEGEQGKKAEPKLIDI